MQDESARIAQEGQWLQQAAVGGAAGEAALRRLIQAYDKTVLYLCKRDYGLTQAEAEDVLQDAVIRISENAARYRAGDDPKPWIWTIVRNLAVSVTRGAWRRHRADAEPADDHAQHDPDAPAPHAADRCVQRGLQEFERVNPQGAEAVRRRYFDGAGIPEIAAFLGRTETATRSYLHALRQKLHPFLKPCFELMS